MIKISELLRQRYELKLSYRDIARSLNISVSTVGDHLARAKAASISWPLPEGVSESELYNKLFPPAATASAQKPLPDFELIHRELRKKGMTLRLLWREYRDIHADGFGYTRFCGRYHEYNKGVTPVMRQIHKAGEKSFVDYSGMTMPWIDANTSELHSAEIFVGSLGASQFTFAEATATQQLPDWINSHVHMWEYFGGVSEMVVPDNLKSGVTKAHRYDPDINANYQHFSEHYGFAIVPARAREPKDKAKVENAVGCIERQILAPLRHRTFTSIGEINEAIKPLLVAFNTQTFQKMKTSRLELFETIDKPVLKALPPDRYDYADWRQTKIHIDYHFVLDDHHYSVPYRYIHQAVQLRVTSKTVECFYQGERVAAHAISHERYGFTTLATHMPLNHRAHAESSPEKMRQLALKIGQKTVEFMDHMVATRAFPQQAFRSCEGLVRLSNRFGEDRLEKACAMALSSGATRYNSVETILKKRLDTLPQSGDEPIPLALCHDNIRGADYYQ